MIQKFLVEIEDERTTRWLAGSENISARLAIATRLIVVQLTEGPKPGILVIQEEMPEKGLSNPASG